MDLVEEPWSQREGGKKIPLGFCARKSANAEFARRSRLLAGCK